MFIAIELLYIGQWIYFVMMATEGKYHVSVSNALKAYHIGYIVNEDRIIKEIANEYGITKHEVRAIAYLYDLLDIRTKSNLRRSRPNYKQFIDSLAFISGWGARGKVIKNLYERGFITWTNDPGKKDRNTFKAGRYYDIGKEGVKVLQSYSGKMAKYYKANYYTKQVEREHERINLLMMQEEATANPQPPPTNTKELTKGADSVDISRLFKDGF